MFIKKLMRFLVFHDWIWAPLIAFLAYWLMNRLPPTLADVAMTYYAINWVQPLIAAAGAMSALMFISRMGMWFYFRILHRFVWPKKKWHESPDKSIAENKDKYEDFNDLTPLQKVCISFFVLFFFFTVGTIVFLKFLAMGGAVSLPE